MQRKTLGRVYAGRHSYLAGTGTGRHRHIILGIPDHDRLPGTHIERLHDINQHPGMWLGGCLIGTSRGIETHVQSGFTQHPV